MAGERYDVAIIGLGSAGLTAAQTAARLGLKTVAVERSRLGGDCLWGGCIPSKALLASARVAAVARDAGRFGVRTGEVEVDRDRVWERIREVQEEIADSDDNPDHYRSLGVDVIEGPARLDGTHAIVVGEKRITARKIVIASGSRPRLPRIRGIEQADPLTTDTIWSLASPPDELVIIGAGPAGVELAQGFARIGTKVALVHRHGTVLPQEEPALAALVGERLAGDGVELLPSTDVTEVEQVEQGTRRLSATGPSGDLIIETSHLLVCCGRTPNTDSLALGAVGIDAGPDGILTDERSRTTASSVYAVGDVAGRHHTHTAGHDAAQAIRDIALPGAGRRAAGVPSVVFTDPELARAGLTFDAARKLFPGKRIERSQRDLAESDRARTDGDPPGKLVAVTMGGRLIGAHLLAPGAGEAIGGVQALVARRASLRSLSGGIQAYPTRVLELQRLAGERVLEQAAALRRRLPGVLR